MFDKIWFTNGANDARLSWSCCSDIHIHLSQPLQLTCSLPVQNHYKCCSCWWKFREKKKEKVKRRKRSFNQGGNIFICFSSSQLLRNPCSLTILAVILTASDLNASAFILVPIAHHLYVITRTLQSNNTVPLYLPLDLARVMCVCRSRVLQRMCIVSNISRMHWM